MFAATDTVMNVGSRVHIVEIPCVKIARPTASVAEKPAAHYVSMKNVTNAIRTFAKIVRKLAIYAKKSSVVIVIIIHVRTAVLKCATPVNVSTTVHQKE